MALEKLKVAVFLAEKPKGAEEDMVEGCPVATQDIAVNIKNRQKAIEVANYGPMNPALSNDSYWVKHAGVFGVSVEEAKKSRCKNCAAFIQTTKMIDCIKKGLDAGPEADAIEAAANLGYCEIFDFKCAGERTCTAWVFGGPITDKNMKDKK